VDSVTQVLDEWKSRAERALFAHRYAAKGFQTLHLWLGIPLVVITAVVGTSMYATLESQPAFWVKAITAGLSVLAAILAAVQTFVSPQDRRQIHNEAAAGFAAVRRNIEEFEALPEDQKPPAKEFLDSVREELDTLARKYPPVPDMYWNKADRDRRGGPEADRTSATC
jgi:Protein of unknown function (DUF4231)